MAVGGVEAFDLGEEEGVIAGRMLGDDVAGEVREGILEERNAGIGVTKSYAEASGGFRVLNGLGEMLGDRLLGIAKYVDAEAVLFADVGEHARVVIDADENEQRIERDRGEGIGGHAVDEAGLALDGDDGDAGGKVPDDATEQLRGKGGTGHGVNLKITQARGRKKSGAEQKKGAAGESSARRWQ